MVIPSLNNPIFLRFPANRHLCIIAHIGGFSKDLIVFLKPVVNFLPLLRGAVILLKLKISLKIYRMLEIREDFFDENDKKHKMY